MVQQFSIYHLIDFKFLLELYNLFKVCPFFFRKCRHPNVSSFFCNILDGWFSSCLPYLKSQTPVQASLNFWSPKSLSIYDRLLSLNMIPAPSGFLHYLIRCHYYVHGYLCTAYNYCIDFCKKGTSFSLGAKTEGWFEIVIGCYIR